jgi:ABC-type sugar transport system substrate-binding protein
MRPTRSGGGVHSAGLQRFALALAVLAALLVLGACGGDDDGEADGGAAVAAAETGAVAEEASDEEGAPLSLEGRKVAIIVAGSHPLYDLIGESATAAVAKLGGESFVLNSQFDEQVERRNLQDALTQGVDGVIMAAISQSGLFSSARLVEEADVPMINMYGFNPGLTPPELVTGYVHVDPTTWGNIIGTELARQLEGKCDDGCQVAQVIGLLGRGEVEAATTAVTTQVQAAGHKVVATPTSNWSPQEAFARTQELANQYPDLKALHVGDENTAVGAVQALKQAGKKPGEIVVTSVYGSPEGIRLINEGWLQATVAFTPAQHGVTAVRMLAQALNEPDPNFPIPCYGPLTLVTAANLDDAPPWEVSDELVDQWLTEPCANQTGSVGG